VTRCRFAVCPWPENANLPLLLSASYSPRGHIYGLPTRRSEFLTRQIAMFPVREGRLSFPIRRRARVSRFPASIVLFGRLPMLYL
jgi:hypothetical protein